MENFNLSDYTLDFEFDFQHDFTANENQVIDELLTHPTDFDGMQENGSPRFAFMCEGSSAFNDLMTITEQLPQPQQQTISNETDFYQQNFPTESSFANPCEIESAANGVENGDELDFDWTTFLDDKASIQSETVNGQSTNATTDQQNQTEQDGQLDSSNALDDNDCVYQELNTLDIPQIYDSLDKAFGLNDLKKMDAYVDYASLSMAEDASQDDHDIALDHTNGLLPKKKVFLVPMELNAESTESLQNVATKLKTHPSILDSMLNQCGNTNKTKKIELSDDPKQIKKQSELCLSIRERLERIAIKEITVATIQPNTQRRHRKQIIEIDSERVPIQFAMDVVVTDINRHGTIINKEKPKAKKQTAKPKAPKENQNRTVE